VTFIITAGAVAAALTAVITLLSLLYRSPVGKWVTRNIREEASERRRSDVTEILDELLPVYLSPVLAELRPNGGSSFRDQVNAFMLEARTHQTHTLNEIDRIHSIIKEHHPA
jgi:hypothetical protein